MFEARLAKFEVNRQAHLAIDSIAVHILDELQEEVVWHQPKSFTPLALFVAGSVTNEKRFDRKGEGTSDLDFLAIVREHFYVDNLYRFGSCLTPGNVVDFAHLRHSIILPEPWDGGRGVDLVLVSLNWFNWVIENIASYTDAQLTPLVNGQDPPFTLLAMGFALFNQLPERYQSPLHRFHRLYKGYTYLDG